MGTATVEEKKQVKTKKFDWRKFLAELDKRLHRREETYKQSYGGFRKYFKFDAFTSARLTIREMQRILRIIEKQNLFITPATSVLHQYDPYYIVGEIIMPLTEKNQKIKILLAFEERQLPKDYNFDELSKIFLTPRNKILIKQTGRQEIQSKSYYYY